MLAPLSPWLLALALCCVASSAAAQTCHMPELGARSEDRVRVGGRAIFAGYRTSAEEGDYQGYLGVASYSHPWFFAEIQVPGYTLLRNGASTRGLGDVYADLRGTVWRGDDGLAAGLELAGTLPSGDAQRHLGMGHVMLMPGAWFGWSSERLQLLAQLAYGRMLGKHHAHSGPMPLVNPMNRSELEHAFSAAYTVSERLFAGGRLLGAVPVAAHHGRAREIAALGLGLRFAPLELAAELQMPLVGTPFELRTVLSLGAVF